MWEFSQWHIWFKKLSEVWNGWYQWPPSSIATHQQIKVNTFDLGEDAEAEENKSVPVKSESEQEAKAKKHPYMCQQCGMGFRHKSSLEVHEYSHKGIVLRKMYSVLMYNKICHLHKLYP